MKHLIAIAAVLALLAMPAMAVPNTDDVTVNIEVVETAQLWADDSVINLTLDGTHPENMDFSVSALNRLHNMECDITAKVTGDLPDPAVAGGGIHFFLFYEFDSDPGNTEADLLARMRPPNNAYAPLGALAWDKEDVDAELEQDFLTNVEEVASVAEVPVAYAASAPGELVMPDQFQLTVTWTIAASN